MNRKILIFTVLFSFFAISPSRATESNLQTHPHELSQNKEENPVSPLRLKAFYVVRHGETDWNKDKKVMGQADIPLNDKGREQARSLTKIIHSLPIERIVASSLRRAQETATILANEIKKPLMVEDNLKECCWGRMEGQVKGNTSYNGLAFDPEQWWQEGIVPEGAESFATYTQRILSAVNRHLESSDSPLLFVAHGGVIMAILQAIGQPSWEVKNCAIYHFSPANPPLSWNVQIIQQPPSS